MKALIVDDDDRLSELISRYLTQNGFSCILSSCVEVACEILKNAHVDVIILDVMLPGINGITFTEQFSANSDIPIVLLTANGKVEDRIKGLKSGASDYISKPFSPQELLLRIQNVLNRKHKFVYFGEFAYDVKSKNLLKGESIVFLTSSESELLYNLVINKNKPLTRDDLIQMCKGIISDRSIDVQIYRLRKKIEKDHKSPIFIKTVRHVGYIFIND